MDRAAGPALARGGSSASGADLESAGEAGHAGDGYSPTSFARRLAVLLLVSGRSALLAITRALRAAARAALERFAPWLAASASPARAARVLAAAARAVLRAAPVQGLMALLSRLVSLRLVLAANDDRGGGARVSARLGTQLALLFGSIRCGLVSSFGLLRIVLLRIVLQKRNNMPAVACLV